MLTISDVSVRFGGLSALDHVSVSVDSGEVLGVIGPNGAGKTTLFNVVCGFVRPSSGTIALDGKLLPRIRPHQLAGLGLARTLQGVGLWQGLSVLQNVMVGARHTAKAGVVSALLGLPRNVRTEATLRDSAYAALDRLDLRAQADRAATSLPYGIQKRVSLARALVGSPRFLLLDEPASGLSTAEMSEMGEIITGLSQSMGVMLVEHHMDLVMSVCSRITVLDFGRVIASGSPDQVRDNPAVTSAYLGNAVEVPGPDH
jgi:branched-chain amino acid transport system ATP-binding protein